MRSKGYRLCLFITIFSLMLVACSAPENSTNNKEIRDNTPTILEPKADALKTIGNNSITFDISHTMDGYIMVKYHGNNPKVKVRITNPQETEPYYYDVYQDYNIYPLTGGNGTYTFTAFESIGGKKYSQLYSQQVDIVIKDEFTTYLYPNQFVYFDKNTKTIEKGKELAKGCTSDLEVLTKIYEYVINNISYDDKKASQVKNGEMTGYLPVVDQILETKTGICFDYSAVLATMLRTQNIPTKMMIGYANMENKSIYHAWISVYIKEAGWIDNMIQFDGKNWSLMDPTTASQKGNASLNKEDYLEKFLY